jgi:hypothetical protein
MRAILIRATGGADALELAELKVLLALHRE